MRSLFSVLFLLACITSFGQSKILHYTETSGFDHNTRNASLSMFQGIALNEGFLVTDDLTGDEFTSLANLEQFDVVVFSNTSGNNILDATQRANFETYISNGGSYLGIHAASDTYRHSTANGSNTGTWDFYAELVGASVQQSPNHVNGTPQYSMNIIAAHPSTQNLPNPWVKNEEYYYWENGFFGINNNAVLQVEETVGPNNMINSYDSERPMSWYRDLPEGGKMFYTALGHASSNFSSDQNFIQHINDALIWILSETVDVYQVGESAKITIRQTTDRVDFAPTSTLSIKVISVYNSNGQIILESQSENGFSTSPFSSGIYFIRITTTEGVFSKKLVFRSE